MYIYMYCLLHIAGLAIYVLPIVLMAGMITAMYIYIHICVYCPLPVAGMIIVIYHTHIYIYTYIHIIAYCLLQE